MKPLKLFVLSISFFLPLGLIVFLHSFGKNEYTLPPVDIPVVPGCQADNLKGDTPIVPGFSFTTQDSAHFSADDLNGKVYVANFIFTSCPTTCPVLTSKLLRIQAAYQDEPNVHILSHTVDPETDTPAKLREYAQAYGANTDTWTFLTGEFDAIRQIARCGYRVLVSQDEADARIVHSETLVLVDQKRRIRGYYDGTDDEEIDRLRTEILLLLREKQ